MVSDRTQRNIRRAAELIAKADALLITAGAGMGVDSGLPDFRGRQGFWRGYPVLEQRGLTFEQMAQPAWFVSDPETAWAFYGHRQQLYRGTKPHLGFAMLLDWGRAMRGGYFVVTSNVDGQFEAAGFAAERIVAVHGSLLAYQCLTPCRKESWRDEAPPLDIDLASMRARGELPRCPFCGGLARPNVLLFDDGAWVSKYRDAQRGRYLHWRAGLKGRRVVVVELGAGTAIPTIRRLGEDLVAGGLRDSGAHQPASVGWRRAGDPDPARGARGVAANRGEVAGAISDGGEEGCGGAARGGSRNGPDCKCGPGATAGAGSGDARVRYSTRHRTRKAGLVVGRREFDQSEIGEPDRPRLGSRGTVQSSRHQHGGPESVRRTLARRSARLRASARGGWLRRVGVQLPRGRDPLDRRSRWRTSRCSADFHLWPG